MIIADDLTGAVDSAAAVGGAEVWACPWVSGDPRRAWNAAWATSSLSVLALSTGSREVQPEVARSRVRDATLWALSVGARPMKKVDSLLRGCTAAEIAACALAAGNPPLLLAPALPSQRRPTLGGMQLGVSVNNLSGFGRRPRASGRRLGDLVPPGYRAVSLTIEQVRSGDLRERLRSILGRSVAVIADAETDTDLANIREAALSVPETLLVGSSGLLRRASGSTCALAPMGGPWIVATASRRRETLSQIDLLRQRDPRTVRFRLPAESPRDTRAVAESVLEYLEDGCTVVISVARRETRAAGGGAHGPVRPVEQELADVVASCARWVRSAVPVAVLGGDLAESVCQSLQVGAIRVCGELQPGTVVCELDDPVGAPLPRFVFRSGAFGSRTGLFELVRPGVVQEAWTP